MSGERTDKKNQHYLPQFLLRNFANPCSRRRAVDVLNLDRKAILPSGSIRHQCAKSFLYGEDGRIENSLQNLEVMAESVIKQLIRTESPPVSERDQIVLTVFISAQYGRTPAAGRSLARQAEAQAQMIRESARSRGIREEEIRYDWNSLSYPKPEAASLSCFVHLSDVIFDLKHAVLINDTTIEFSISDVGVVLHNHWADGIGRLGGNGFGNHGIMFVLPLSPRVALLKYDSAVYRIRGRPGNVIHINQEKYINSLNYLQALFAEENMYFSGNHETGKSLLNIVETCPRKRRSEAVRSKFSTSNDDNKSDIFTIYSEMPAVLLSLPWLPIRKPYCDLPLAERVQVRPAAARAFEVLRQRQPRR